MYRFLLTPRWWGINLFAVLAIPVCLFMGSWQLSRFEDRADTHKRQEQEANDARTAKAAPLHDLLPVSTESSGRVARATGHYDAKHQLLVPDRDLDDKNGFYVLDLLRTDKQSGGKALPVVRGWLPGKVDPGKVPAPPKGEVTVEGALQASESQGSPGVNAGTLPDGQLGMISAASLVNVVPYDVYDAWISVQRVPSSDKPLKPVPPTAPDNSGLDMKAFQNLGYTGEWFVFAGFVVFMWFRLFRREAELAKDRALGLVPEQPEGEQPEGERDAAGEPERGPEAEPEGPEPGPDPARESDPSRDQTSEARSQTP
ncbi:SURF1 family protein [Streptomyces sp. ODS28]|uniref:SURF1 family protein n=1 Tax=Streptomyces sp. ODS28 TaxID=3136688 RepID=UPI0031E7FAB3